MIDLGAIFAPPRKCSLRRDRYTTLLTGTILAREAVRILRSSSWQHRGPEAWEKVQEISFNPLDLALPLNDFSDRYLAPIVWNLAWPTRPSYVLRDGMVCIGVAQDEGASCEVWYTYDRAAGLGTIQVWMTWEPKPVHDAPFFWLGALSEAA